MRAAQDTDDATFGPTCSGHPAETSNFGDDSIAMHGVFDLVARNEDVAIDVGKSDLGNNETVAVLVMDEAAANFIARSGFVLREFVGRRGGWSWSGVAFLATKEEAAVRKLFD
jgi:hypothetical protein